MTAFLSGLHSEVHAGPGSGSPGRGSRECFRAIYITVGRGPESVTVTERVEGSTAASAASHSTPNFSAGK